MNDANYRKHNDRTHNSSTYHKKDGTPVRAILKREAQQEIDEMTTKTDDTNTVPDKLTAVWLKRFFKRKFGIPVRVRTLKGRAGYIDVWIPSTGRVGGAITWEHNFPAALGNRCMRVVYSGSESLQEQNWGGNIRGDSLTMVVPQWRKVLQQCIDDPIPVEG